jgi:hypothetical protein
MRRGNHCGSLKADGGTSVPADGGVRVPQASQNLRKPAVAIAWFMIRSAAVS